MADTYTTRGGEQWDQIALAVYGDEGKTGFLMESNPRQLGIFQFDAGTVLNTPALPEGQDGSLPPWRFQQ